MRGDRRRQPARPPNRPGRAGVSGSAEHDQSEPRPFVWIVEDDESLRGNLIRRLQNAEFDVAGFDSAEAFLGEFDPARPGCVVLDVHLPGRDGLHVQDELAERAPEIPILFISGRADVDLAVRAMKGGALDFLQKPFSGRELLAAVGRAVERDIQSRRRRERRAALASRLTDRERQVLDLMLGGLATKEIAAEFGISPRTVEIHRRRVLQKLEVDSVVSLIRLFFSDEPPPSGGDAPAGRGSEKRSG